MGDYFISARPGFDNLTPPGRMRSACIILMRFYIPDFQFSLLLNEQPAANNRKIFFYLPGISVSVFAGDGTDTGWQFCL